MKYYTGVGSRKTPSSIIRLMTETAAYLEKEGWILRSGGADGADSAFEAGVKDRGKMTIFYANHANDEAMQLAASIHPAWDRCSPFAKKLHARNCFQVLGPDLKTPSKMLICWTPDACVSSKTRSIETGGTGTAIALAEKYGVTIFNLANPEHYERIVKKVRG